MAKSEYLKVKINGEEKAKLAAMVASGKISSMSDGVRKLAFAERSLDFEILRQYLETLAEAKSSLRTAAVELGTKLSKKAEEAEKGAAVESFEADIVLMEKTIDELSRNAAEFARLFRRCL